MSILTTTILVIVALTTSTIGWFSVLSTDAFACYTPAQGCIEQGGPGQSFLARPEVAGCHFFPPTTDCVTSSTPPGMGAGPK